MLSGIGLCCYFLWLDVVGGFVWLCLYLLYWCADLVPAGVGLRDVFVIVVNDLLCFGFCRFGICFVLCYACFA